MLNWKRIFRKKDGQKGFVAISAAAILTVTLGFAGMAVDTGYMQWNRRRVQLAADAAAMGALRELEKNRLQSVESAGLNDAAMNGFTDGVANTIVDIQRPPLTGAFANNTQAVQAVVKRNVPTLFMRIFGPNNILVTASAVGHIASSSGSIGGCVFALNKTMKSALQVTGTTVINTNCSISVSSDDCDAFTLGGNAEIRLGAGANVGVVGDWTLLGQSEILDVSVNPAVTKCPVHIQDPGDPFATMATPSTINVTSTTIQASNGASYSKNSPPTANKIYPGVYCNGISIGDTNGATYEFQPGVYILAGGGLSLGSSAKASGTGVMFYNTGTGGTNYSQWGCGNKSYKPLAITGQGELNISAPTSGPFVGMAFYGDRLLGSGNGKFDQIVGNSSSTFNGAIYFKKGNVKFAGKSSTNGYLVLVADNITITGTSTLGNNYTVLGQPNPFAPFATGGGLVE
jgi:hypothetical protein